MIKKTLIYFLVLFVLYNAVIYLWKPDISTGQSQNQGNIVSAENYIFNAKGKDIVIVGSSLAFRMKQDYLPNNYYNLAFGGNSIYDGLEIIKRSGNIPKIILIETNILMRPANAGFVNGLFAPGLSEAKKGLPGMREAYQPVNLLIGSLQHLMAKNKTTTAAAKPDSALYDTVLHRYRREYSHVPDLDTIDSRIETLKAYTEYFRGLGIQVVLFEMPVDCSLENSARTRYLHKKLEFEFPDKIYPRILSPDCTKFTFNDGEHLSATSAMDYSDYLAKQVGLIGK